MTSRPVETPPVTEPDALGSFPLRAMLVALFTSFGASAATFPLTGLRSRQFPAELVPHFEIPAWLLLGAVLAQAMVLGMRGRISASWAVVAFGSLGVALTTYAVAVVWYGADIIRTQWLGVLLLVPQQRSKC